MPLTIDQDAVRQVKAGLQEIFSSIQGEGIYVGKRQIFVRFNACHLKCQYCDTPQRPAAEQCEIETISGSSEKVQVQNPLSVEQVLHWITHLQQQFKHHSISFTGGEPLLYTDFLSALLPQLDDALPVYLETSGTQPEALQRLLPWIRIIAMDIKLSSATGEPMPLENHQRFYQIARTRDMYIKLVFSEDTTTDEIDATRAIVTDPGMPIILQPMTSLQTGENTVSASKIFEMEQYLSRYFQDVRVIPQTHKMLDLL